MRIDFDEVDILECTDVDDIIWAVEKLIDSQPAVDAVKVVRCKDCARADLYSNRPCYLFCMEHHRLVEKDDFCSYGERKDNE